MKSTRRSPSVRRSMRSSTITPPTSIRRCANGLPNTRAGPSTSHRPRPHGSTPLKASSPSSPTGASNVAYSDQSRSSKPPSSASSQRPTPTPNPSCGPHAQTASSRLSNVGSKLAQCQPADDGVTERLRDLRAGAGADHQRHGTQHRRQRRHEDRPEAFDTSLVDRFFRRQALVALGVNGEVDHHDAVLLDDADEQDDP